MCVCVARQPSSPHAHALHLLYSTQHNIIATTGTIIVVVAQRVEGLKCGFKVQSEWSNYYNAEELASNLDELAKLKAGAPSSKL